MKIVKGQRLSPATEFKKGQKPQHKADYGKRTSERLMGHIVTEATREKLRKANLGIRGKMKHTDDWKKERSRAMIGNTAWKNARGRKKFDTKPERMLEWAIKNMGWNYEKQTHLCGITFADFYLPEYKIVIYADGDYWHSRPQAIFRDTRNNRILKKNGFKVYRFLASEIEKSAMGCIRQILIPTSGK